MTFEVIDGGAKTVDELETEALLELHAVAQKYSGELRAARSPLRRMWHVIEDETESMLERRGALLEAVR